MKLSPILRKKTTKGKEKVSVEYQGSTMIRGHVGFAKEQVDVGLDNILVYFILALT